ncbi:MAG: ATP-binding protein [Paludibacteraceae bacterium]|nr:ATP-binding protein [Paludibacteraceae bacterium]MDD6747786.1 ATP-binding protein [Paludibacteraceae bacterium]
MNINIINPFITTGYAGAAYFCDREQETADITRMLVNGNNVALISPRRYGKTNLIRHCFAQPEIAEKYYTFVIDIYSTKSVADLVHRLGLSILEALKPLGRKAWEKFITVLSSVRSGISYDISGNPSWMMSIGDITTPTTTLEEIFYYLEHADKPCIVAIDEFQQITHYGDERIEATLRTHVQQCTNTHFIFSGSQRHLMGQMFTSPARPFYQSVSIYNLPLLPEDKYVEFCVRLFEEYGKHLSQDVPHALYERFGGVTYYMQRVMNELFSRTLTDGICTAENIEEAIHYIILTSASTYEDLMYQLPEKQSLVLRAIAKEGKAQNLTSGKFIKRHGLLSASSVKSAVPALLDKGLITSDKGVYQVYDKFLEIWLQL